MDVTCERCGTEYEFDETLLSGRGTSVKCTNCGHVFKVFPTASREAEQPSNSWRLKLEDGSIDEIDSLRELQRRIISGELSPENAIARGDDDWKTLGSIPELETFFHAAGVRIPSGRIPSPLPPVIAPSERKESSIPPGRRPRQPTLLGVMPVQRTKLEDAGAQAEASTGPAAAPGSVTGPATEVASVAEPVPATASAAGPVAAVVSGSATAEELGGEAEEASYRSSYISDPGPDPQSSSASPRGEIEDAEFEEEPPKPSGSSMRTSTPPPAYYDDDDDIPSLPNRGGSPLRWLLAIVVVGGLALVVAQWPRIAGLIGIGSDPALIAAGVAEGDAAIAEGHAEAYASAIEAYGQAIASGAERDADIMAKLSNAYALAAQAQIDNGAHEDRIAPLTSGALSTAVTAMDLDPSSLGARLAQADALRLAGRNTEAREVLESARSMSFSRTAEFFRVDARLRAAEAEGDLQPGLRSAKQAAELAPQGVRYLLLVARSEAASGNAASARASLETVLRDHPDHPVALRLLEELEAADVVVDAGVTVDAGLPADGAVEKATDSEEKTPSATETVPAAAAAAVPAPNPQDEKTKSAKPAASPKPARKPRTSAKPAYDEYDRLAEAAGDDAFVDGRPPVRDYEWYMREGRTELAGGNYSRARALFDSALEASPGSADAMDALAQVSIGIEDFDSAIRYFRVAAQRGHPDGYFNLAKTYERMGRNEEAVSAYYTYVKRRPSGSHASAARAAIKTLEPNAKLPPAPESEPESEPEPGMIPADEPTQESEPATP